MARHDRIRKKWHILIEGDNVPPPVKTFKVSSGNAQSFLTAPFCADFVLFLSVRLSVYEGDEVSSPNSHSYEEEGHIQTNSHSSPRLACCVSAYVSLEAILCDEG